MNDLRQTIKAHPLFLSMKLEHLDILAVGATEARFEPGQILLRAGEPANQLFLIERGRIVLETRGTEKGRSMVQNLGPGDALGWSWLFPPFGWHFQARVEEPTEAVVLSGAHLLVAAEADHDFGYELMKRVAHLVIHRLESMGKQLLEAQTELALKH
jgi:CRP/FNR family cyclic AMP-dependent transcriptional regulator